MTDDIDFDDLFALPEPKPATVKEIVTVETAAAYACPCSARCDVIQPAPAVIKCWNCKWDTMARYVSAYPVPAGNAIRVEAGA